MLQLSYLDFIFPFSQVAEGCEHEAVPLEGRHEVLPLEHGGHLLISASLRLDEHVRLNGGEKGGNDGAHIRHIDVDLLACNNRTWVEGECITSFRLSLVGGYSTKWATPFTCIPAHHAGLLGCEISWSDLQTNSQRECQLHVYELVDLRYITGDFSEKVLAKCGIAYFNTDWHTLLLPVIELPSGGVVLKREGRRRGASVRSAVERY